MTEPKITKKLVEAHGLSREEYNRIIKILGRKPTYTELGIFSVMWSEHCSYKNSIKLLKTLPREGKNLLTKAGEENAGAVEIGDGLAIVFKVESHNHPCAVEPYQGAATGVGGIMRDIFTMGARPIACFDPLHFGELSSPRVRYLFDGVVRGIGDYGNCFGVPTIGGEVYFEESYTGNPIVNVLAIGVVKKGQIMKGAAKGAGNAVLIVGSSTGRDGIHGATFASEEISEKSQEKRPSVQIGDPFMEKLLLEATLEVIKADLAVGIQDMGAAGITCSTSEMAARGNSGMEIDISLVPVREEKMTPYEIMLSESQERMLVVAKKDKEKEVQQVFSKWGLNSIIIGYVTDDGILRVKNNGKTVAEIPADCLVLGGGAPIYTREKKKPKYLNEVSKLDLSSIKIPKDLNQVLLKLAGSPNICSKRWVYEQYDTMVRTGTIVGPGSDAGVLRLRKTDKLIALSTDCNPRYCYLNPYLGTIIAVSEAARNLACSGAKPLAITNCLNFGNPYKPEIYWTFAECVRGMGDACRKFDTPVTGGNVSFYNEDPNGAVYPTPVIGMLGVIDNIKYVTTQWFKDDRDLIVLLGKTKQELGGTEYLKIIHNKTQGSPPDLNLDYEQGVQGACLEAIYSGIAKSAHDCSEGGLAIALTECCITSPNGFKGAEIKLKENMRADALLFGESQSRIIVSLEKKNLAKLEKIVSKYKIDYSILGEVKGSRLKINDWIDVSLEKIKETYESSLRQMIERKE